MRKQDRNNVILAFMVIGMLFLVLVLAGCSDDVTNIITNPAGVPKKCLDDPCLPGCPPHGFECPPEPPPEPCSPRDTIACTCEDPAENNPVQCPGLP